MLEPFVGAVAYLADPQFWLVFALGLAIATSISLIPGIGSVLMLGIALPLVILGIEEAAIGIVLLATITGTSNTFDSIPAQLMGIVNSGSQVSFLEGHQLARKGKGAYSLGAVYAVSAIGGLVGALLLLMVLPVIRPFILMVSFGEIAVLALFGILMVSVMSHGAMLKGLAAGFLGLILGLVGTQGNTGDQRFTFGSYDLETGLPLVAAVVGLMALPEMIDLIVHGAPVAPKDADVSQAEVFRGFRAGLRRWKMAVRQSLFGAALGAVPGAGSAVVTWLSYGLGIALWKGDRSQFGKGSLDGLLFVESAENAKEGGQALPTLALGIPAATSWALVLVGMMAYGITPGPDILDEHADIVGLIIMTFALANLVLTVLALLVTRQLMRLTQIPYPAIGGAVIPIVVIGAYLSDLVAVTIPVLIIFTAVGLIMKAYGWPRPPAVLALVLAPVIEDNLFTAVSVFGVTGFLTRPLTIILAIAVVVTVVFLHRKMKAATESAIENLDLPTDSDDTEYGDVAVKAPPKTAARRILRAPVAVALGFALVGAYAISELTTWSGLRSALLPAIGAVGLLAAAGAQLVLEIRDPDRRQGQIMDLGMRSAAGTTSPLAVRTACLILGAYVIGIWIIGLQWAGILFAFALPPLMMRHRHRWLIGVVAAACVAAFSFGVADGLLHVFWPDSLLMIGQ